MRPLGLSFYVAFATVLIAVDVVVFIEWRGVRAETRDISKRNEVAFPAQLKQARRKLVGLTARAETVQRSIFSGAERAKSASEKSESQRRDNAIDLAVTESEDGNAAVSSDVVRRGNIGAEVDFKYSPFLATLKTNPDIQERVRNALIEREMTLQDAMMLARSQGIPRKEIWTSGKLDGYIDGGLAAILADKYPQFRAFEAKMSARNTASMLENYLYYPSATLVDEDIDKIANLLMQSQTEQQINLQKRSNLLGVVPTPISRRFLNEARKVLPQEQALALQELQQHQVRTRTLQAILSDPELTPPAKK